MFYCGHMSSGPAANCHKLSVDVRELDTAILDMIRKQAAVMPNTCNLSELRTAGADGMQITRLKQAERDRRAGLKTTDIAERCVYL